ncbi:BPSS1780 family membrane protein [Nitrosospira sp. NpAV]|uniref:BPSS1780 family membrane protein n=1 Tax=Nitrosospira sp. NpAV TaxID=58133 RepID=UPI0005A05577|nr:BPSS1780 family membrane protein [Nitrosospira sp. NpAV]KIO50314.1 membrane protein [Nitrosospira sp. NpAV]
MEVRQVDAKQGWQWIMTGFFIFRQIPVMWILLCTTLLLIAATLSLIPMAGQFIFTLLSPVFLAGLMIGCRALEQGEKLEIAHLLAGFRNTSGPLITIGGIYLVGQVLILGIFMLVGGDVLMDLLIEGKRVDENELKNVSGDMLSASLVGLSLSIPLMMATWFAPLLVIFNGMPAVDAMRLSFFACLKNIIAFQIYGITLVALTILASIPYGLGLFVLVPTLFASIYASYRDIFVDTAESAESA